MSIDINWSLLNSSDSTQDKDQGVGPSTSTSTSTFNNSFSSTNLDDPGIPDTDVEDALSSSLIQLLNEQLSTSKRPSFIGPITVTSFSFGDLGPELEIKDIRDVWRVFDQGDEEGDELLAEQEKEERLRMLEKEERERMERRGVISGLEDERYEYVNLDNYVDQEDIPNKRDIRVGSRNRDRNRSYGHGHGHGYSQSYSKSHSQYAGTTPIPRSISNTHTLSIADHQSTTQSHSGKSYIPFPFDPNSSTLNHHHQHPNQIGITPSTSSVSMSMFSPGLGRRPASIAGSISGHRPPSVVGIGIGVTSLLPPASAIHSIHPHQDQIPPPPPAPLTRDHSYSLPPSPPALPPKGLPAPSSSNNVPSAQIHFNLKHKSNLNLVLLTSLQVNYPSNLFMSLPLKISITGFTLQSDLVVAYSSEKNRLHLTVLPPQDDQNPNNTNQDYGYGYGYGYNKRNSMYSNQSIGEKIIPSLQIESEIGHSDAHVLRNVGKVEKFIVDVIRKTVVDELVFPNFHTIAL
ncbi:hypothetical protein I203_107563 [Kwoniella mangroviensis CBS 8507]|uniref:hypothetical protein n=1 Tax=Kwoniella mangroviensis CBS 8507 TaxID=1296122 RepID=UPI00080D2176|nr:uncharacterized protein I203_02313 [Kwoniella mangroviensis CBS 8507]OCF68919.1 hypothetical protein I203_02313 [Kwoniella mangroviensis CBS 8507]